MLHEEGGGEKGMFALVFQFTGSYIQAQRAPSVRRINARAIFRTQHSPPQPVPAQASSGQPAAYDYMHHVSRYNTRWN